MPLRFHDLLKVTAESVLFHIVFRFLIVYRRERGCFFSDIHQWQRFNNRRLLRAETGHYQPTLFSANGHPPFLEPICIAFNETRCFLDNALPTLPFGVERGEVRERGDFRT